MPRSLRHIVLAALITIALPAAAQDSTRADWVRNPGMGNYKAYAEFKMGRYAAAREVWEVLAGVGNAEALFNLGILAEDGLGEAQDMAKAEALYVAAANAGGRKAQYRLGLLYGPGGALGPDPDKARHYLGLAAAGGDQDAADQLAAMARPDAAPDDFTRAERLSAGGRHAEPRRCSVDSPRTGMSARVPDWPGCSRPGGASSPTWRAPRRCSRARPRQAMQKRSTRSR